MTNIVLIIFIILELSNILIIYFKPDFKYGNSVSVFKEWTKKEDENDTLYKKYMVYWVANSKLIFITLLIIIVMMGTPLLKLVTCIALIPSIAVYYINLHPLIKKMDINKRLNKKGYSSKLALIISSFILMFIIVTLIELFK